MKRPDPHQAGLFGVAPARAADELPGQTFLPLTTQEHHKPYVLDCGCCDCIEQRGISADLDRRARTYGNGQLYACPTCKRPNLTSREKARGYQCRNCTASEEGVG